MTDAELIELVQTKTPSDLTAAEVAELGARLKECPALQEALAEHLEMERYLADVLGNVRISSEQVLARAVPAAAAARLRHRMRRWAALALLLSIVLAGGLFGWFFGIRTGGDRPEDTADSGAVAEAPTQPSPGKPTEAVAAPPPDSAPEPKVSSPDEPPPVAVEPPRNTAPEPYALVDLTERGLNEAQLKAWFDPVEGLPHIIRTLPPPKVRGITTVETTEMSGWWRLRTPWKDGSALRCLFRIVSPCKFHIWNGTEGVTLELWRTATKDPNLPEVGLVAYRTTRKGREPQPETLELAASDEGELGRTRTQMLQYGYARLVSTPIDLRHEDGLLTVSFGDVRLLSVPFAAAPAEVYLEGAVSFQALGIAPLLALPPVPPPLPTGLDVEKPAELKWLGDPAHRANQADGSVELSAEKATGRVTAATVLPPQRICELVVQLEGVMPGTGVYLGDEKGEMHYVASFLREETTGRTLLLETGPTDTATSVRQTSTTRWPPAYVADKVWLRLLLACGQLKCWVSSDGVHWARAFESPSGRVAETCASLGLYCQAEGPPRTLRLRRLMLPELRTLNSLAPAELVRQAPLVPHGLGMSLTDWLLAAHAVRPADVDAVVWSRACALRALAAGVSPQLGVPMLENLLDHGLRQKLPPDARLRLIDEALLLVPRSSSATAQRFMHYYERLGEALHREGEARPYSCLRQALYHNPLWSFSSGDAFAESLATGEMLDLAAAGHWGETELLARFGRIHHVSPSVFEWAETLTGRRRPPKAKQGARRKPLPSNWQAALLLDLDKDGTTDLGEIEAALRAQSYREAGRILTHIQGHSDRSLLPDSSDGQRLMCWPVAIAGLVEAHPELRTLLRTEFAPEGRLQLRRALDEKDEMALEALALRFPGTDEAAEALLWLGDRCLVDGDPALAVGRYRQALRMTEGALRRRIEDRLQLTAALLGQPVTTLPAEDIKFGDMRLSPAALQALRQKRRADGVDSRWAAGLPPQLAPAPSVFDVEPRGRFEGETGDKPTALPLLFPAGARFEDWFARQIALAADGNRLIVSNRFQVDCYALPSGELQWRTALSRDAARQEMPAPANEYPLTPMRPVIAGPRLFVRRLMRGPGGPTIMAPVAVATLACLDIATGSVLWSTTNHRTGQLHYVSDPLVIQDQVFVVGQKRAAEGDGALVLMIHDRSNGTLLAERLLAPVRASLDDQRGCQLTAREDSCLATVGGSVLCFDLAGNLRWARRPLWIPPEADAHWVYQSHEPPLIIGDRCFVVQPGVLNLVSLDPETGRLYWQKAVIGLRRLAGCVDGRLIVQIDSGFLCLDAATGTEQWRHEVPHLLSSVLCGGPGGLLYSTADAIPGEKGLYHPTLVWVDLESGREKTSFPLDSLRHVEPRLGPLFVAGGRLWAFAGKGGDLTRDLIELVPKGQDLPATPAATEWEAWARNAPGPLHAAAARVLPGWTVFDGKAHPKIGVAEFQGERNVLCAPASFAIGRHLTIPAEGNPRLVLRVNNEAKKACKLAVDVDGKRLWLQDVYFPTTGDQWKDWEVDFSAFKGQRVWVVVRHLSSDPAAACSFWSKIELRD
jgi:outer membrane protein assembly factor BamB